MTSELNSILDKATSPSLVELDVGATLNIVDMVRQYDVKPKDAVSVIVSRLKNTNPNTVLMTLQVLEYLMKNCGSAVHEEMCSSQHMAALDEVVCGSANEEVREAACGLLGQWCSAFRDQPRLKAVQDVVMILRAKGFSVPEPSASSAMYRADSAPGWADASCCHRCRTNFSTFRRKHHCRACGQVFCHDCSKYTSNIPKYGIEREVRVCEGCYTGIHSPKTAKATQPKEEKETKKSKSSSAKPAGKSEEELREEEELQLALALSRSEAEKTPLAPSSAFSPPSWRSSAPPHSPSPSLPSLPTQDSVDPELAKYLNRPYWEEQHGTKAAMAGMPPAEEQSSVMTATSVVTSPSVGKVAETPLHTPPDDAAQLSRTLRCQLEMFVNRMRANQCRQRAIANDSAVQGLFLTITTMHAQLLHQIQLQEQQRVYYEKLQDKLSQARDARAALDALREEHRDGEKREREEQQRIRQQQMQQKLALMRQKKQEYLEYQRQMALHRMAHTERQIRQPYYEGQQMPPATYPGGVPQPAYHLPQYLPGHPTSHFPSPSPALQSDQSTMVAPHPMMAMQPGLNQGVTTPSHNQAPTMQQPQPTMQQPQPTMQQPQPTMQQPQPTVQQPQPTMQQPHSMAVQPTQPQQFAPQPTQPQQFGSQPAQFASQPQQFAAQPSQPQMHLPPMSQPQMQMSQQMMLPQVHQQPQMSTMVQQPMPQPQQPTIAQPTIAASQPEQPQEEAELISFD